MNGDVAKPAATSPFVRAATPAAFRVERVRACVQEVLAFRNANRVVAREERYFEWRYRRPCAHEPLIVWARDPQGQPIGAASLIPHDYFVLDGIYPVGVLGDISVLPAYRGQGVAGRMLSFLAGHPVLRSLRACVVLPNDEAEGPLQRAGWRATTVIHRYVKPLDAQPMLERTLGSGAAVRWIAAGINGLLRLASCESWSRAAGYDVRLTEAFDARYDELWSALTSPGRVIAVRNRAYLTWRFAEHPLVRHRIFELSRAGSLRAFLVFHVSDGLAVVDDYAVAEPDAGRALFLSFFEWLRGAREATAVQLRTNRDGPMTLPRLRLGFVPRRDVQRVMVLDPHDTNSPVANSRRWHVTPGDKDV